MLQLAYITNSIHYGTCRRGGSVNSLIDIRRRMPPKVVALFLLRETDTLVLDHDTPVFSSFFFFHPREVHVESNFF